MKKYLRSLLPILIFIILFSSFSFGQGYSRRITAWFNNIRVIVDGRILETPNEPFIFNDVLYAPVLDLMDALYVTANYNENTRALEIKNNLVNASSRDLLATSHAKDIRISVLERELAILQNEIKRLEEEMDYFTFRYGHRYHNIPYYTINNLSSMRNYLSQHYGDIAGTNVSITLSHNSGNLYTLTVSSTNLSQSLNSVPRRFIEYWLEDVLFTIRNYYDSNARIHGSIRQLNSNSVYENVTTFTTGNEGLIFNHR